MTLSKDELSMLVDGLDNETKVKATMPLTSEMLQEAYVCALTADRFTEEELDFLHLRGPDLDYVAVPRFVILSLVLHMDEKAKFEITKLISQTVPISSDIH